MPFGKEEVSRLHRRLRGLAEQVRKELDHADARGRPMSKREQEDLNHILSRMDEMLRDDIKDCQQAQRQESRGEMPVRNSRQYLNPQCEFFDLDANRIQCAIGCDMFRCSRKCRFATNVPGAEPPYGTKYMKGWIGR